MSFTDNFLKELEKRKKKIDNSIVISPYSSENGKESQKAQSGNSFTDSFLSELGKLAEKNNTTYEIPTFSEEEEYEDIAPIRSDKEGGRSGKFGVTDDMSETDKRKFELENNIRDLKDELGYNDSWVKQMLSFGWLTDIVDGISGVDSERTANKKLLASYEEELAKLNGEEEKKKSSWLKGGAFEDGWQGGDLLKTAGATIADTAIGIVQGAGNTLEGISDLILHGASKVTDWVGADSVSDYLEESANSNTVNNLADSIRKGFIKENTIYGDKGHGVPEAIGQILGLGKVSKALQALGWGAKAISSATTLMMGSSSMGSGISEAKNHGNELEDFAKQSVQDLDKALEDGLLTQEQYDAKIAELNEALDGKLDEALKGNLTTDAEAWSYGAMKGVIDAGSELIFGGLGKSVNALGFNRGLSSLDDAFAKKLSSGLTKHVANKHTKRIIANGTEYIVKAGAEGFEEVLAGYGSALAKKLTYMSDEELSELVEDENLFEQFLVSFVASGIMQGKDLYTSVKNDTDFVTGLTDNEQAVINKEVEKQIAEAEKAKGEKLTNKEKAEIQERVENELEKGYISIDTIEEALGGESYKSYQDTVKKEDSVIEEEKTLRDEFNTLNRMKKGDMTGEQTDRLEELRTKLSELTTQIEETKKTSERDFLQRKYKSEVEEIAKGSKLEESYKERARRGEKYTADLSKYNKKQREVIQNAIDSGVLNNTNRSHEFVDLVAKISADKGVSFDFTNNEKLKSSGFAIDGVTVNGYVTKDGVTVNMQSSKSLNSVVGHEIAHVLEGTGLYSELQKAITEYAKSKGDYQGRYDTLSKLYENIEGADIDSEITADLVGDYLFTDADFVNNLSAKHRNVFQKIYDEIKYLYKVATAGTKEARELERVKKVFEEAYRAQGEAAEQSGTKLSIAKTSKMPYNDQLQQIEKGQMNGSNSLYVGTSENLSKVGFSNAPFAMNQSDYRKSRRETAKNSKYSSHAVPYDFFENLPDHLNNAPMLVDNGDKVTVITPYATKDTKGNDSYVIAGVWQNQQMESDTVNLVKSVYPWDDFADRIKRYAEAGSLVVTNKNKVEQMLTTIGIQPAEVSRLLNLAKDSISQKENVVNRKFSLSEAVEETNDLMALHNLKGTELLKSLELGGLPMPSIAIIKAEANHDQYGEISLILPKEAIDPKANKDNKIYGADAWTPTYPKIEFKPNEAVKDSYSKRMLDIANRIMDKGERNRFIALDNAMECIVDAVRKSKTKAGIYKEMKQYRQLNVTEQDVEDIVSLVTDISNMPTGYFESKPMRAVGFDEVGVFVIPNNADVKLKQELLNRGYSIAEYDPDVEGNRQKVVNSFEQYKFSLSDVGEAPKEYGNYNVYGKDIAYEGAAADVAPIRDDVAPAENDVLSDDYAPMTEEEAAMMESEILDSLTDEDAPPEVDTPYDVQRDTGTIEDKPLKKISDKASEYLGLNRNERVTFENIVQNYSQNENLDRDYLFSQIRDNFSVREEIMQNDDVRQMKKDIKSMGIFVSDAVKGDFGKGQDGYIKFLRSNFGKLRIVKDATNGIEVDSAYEELSSLYPSYFPEDIINPADRLRQIADVAGMSAEESFPIEVSEAEIQEVADMVYIGVSEYMNESRLNAAEEINAPYSDTDAPLIESDIEAEENKVLTIREMYDQKKQKYRESLAAFEAGKEKSLYSFNEAIGKKLDEYNSLKNKNTKRANTLLQQIENLRLRRDNVQADYSNRIAKQQARLENFESKSFEEFEKDALTVRRTDIRNQKIDDIKSTFTENGRNFDEDLANAKDLWTIKTVENTPQRVMDKAFGWEAGHLLSDMTVNKVAQHTTEGIKWLNTITDKKNGLIAQLVKDYGIKPGSKASKAAQMYAEGFWVDKNENIWKYGDTELEKDFPDSKVRENIKALSKDQRIRQFYDDTLKAINESRARNAYPEIQKLENYFLHFREQADFFSRNGLPFNPKDMRSKNLPTDVLGTTIDRRPGQPFFASGMHREGKRTSFDILRGIEMYANSALPQIYYIDDIQTLRALQNYVAESYGQAKGLENLNALSDEEAAAKIKEVYKGHLATFASFLNEEANILAGKTALVDRGFSEGAIGRGAMTFMNTLNRQVGSNQVGYNVSSALTNLIAPVQAFAKTNKADFIKGFAQTVSNRISGIHGKSDGFTDESPVVIRRKGAERYYRNFWQKMSDPGYALAGAVDNFSTELIARAKYNELTRKGMDSETAHVETDKWVSRLMGDRSLGQQPLIYNSKVLGILTKYQLEVRNQLDSQFYDTIQEAKASTEDIENGLERNAKRAAKITATFAELAIGQHIFGKVFESIAGYNPAFDIINVIIKAFGFDDDEESEDTILDNFGQALYELSGDMPYSSLFLDGGRVPMANAIPDVGQILNGEDDYGRKIGFEASLIENLAEVAPYYLMPGGYGQLKKTTQGLGMFDDELPISGSYTDSDKLRFPVEDTLLNRVQAGIFGQYASPNARDYFDNERKALDEKQIQEFVDSGISIQDYWDYREGLSGLKTLNEKADYINSLDLPVEVKNLFINNLSDRKDPIDLSGMEGYTDFNEYDFAQKNPEKYEWLKNNGITVEQYEGFDKETKEEYDFAYKSPEKYVVAKSVGGYSSYKTYTSDLYDIKADKDSDGKTISGSRKNKVIDYINNLDADYGEKIILFKSEYPADDTYNYEIIDYLNSRDDISYEEMNTILKELGFTIQPDGVTITWD